MIALAQFWIASCAGLLSSNPFFRSPTLPLRCIWLTLQVCPVPSHCLPQALLMHSEPGLTTTETKRSPLVAVVALPTVLADGQQGAAAGGPTLSLLGAEQEGRTTISWTMYNDGGEEPEVGAGASMGRAVCIAPQTAVVVRGCLRKTDGIVTLACFGEPGCCGC